MKKINKNTLINERLQYVCCYGLTVISTNFLHYQLNKHAWDSGWPFEYQTIFSLLPLTNMTEFLCHTKKPGVRKGYICAS